MDDPGVDCHPLDLAARGDADLALLDDVERARATRFRFDIHRDRYIAAHAGLRRVLGERLGLAPAAVRLTTTRFGKPLLDARVHPDRSPAARPDWGGAGPGLHGSPLHFNLTHSDDAGWVAVAPFPVGVDVECPRPFDELEPLIRSHCTTAEIAALAAQPAAARALGFLTIWTRKEAVLKAWGTGIGAVPLDALDVGLDAGRIEPLAGSAVHPPLYLSTCRVGLQVLTVAAASAGPPRIRLRGPG